jgi:hypothetical protein
VLLADQRYTIVRPFVSTPTAKDIAGAEHAWRLPAVQPDETASTTYIRWLLKTRGLPELRVRTAPTARERRLVGPDTGCQVKHDPGADLRKFLPQMAVQLLIVTWIPISALLVEIRNASPLTLVS